MEPTISSGSQLAREVNIHGSRFDNVNLADSTFTNANMHNVRFDDVNLAGAVFENINFHNVKLSNANYDGMTIDGIPVTVLLSAYKSST